MMARLDWLRGWGASVLVALATLTGFGADGPPIPKGQQAVAPVAPELPGGVVVAMQEGKYDEAKAAFDRLIAGAKTLSEKSYYRFLRGVAERLSGNAAEARRTLAEALEAEPKGPWAAKIRFELAAVELAAGRPAQAEGLARLEAETLLGPERKDRLAEVYHAFARRLLTPDDPVSKPDPAGAYALLGKARELAKGETLRASLLYEMARAEQAALHAANPNSMNAIRDFQAYLKEYPKGADRFAARFHLGETQLMAGQNVAARMTFIDLTRDLSAEIAKNPSKEQVDLKVQALYQIARTHGIATPPDNTQLNLGVAALRRFLTEAPSNPKAPRASYEIGASYQARNRGEAAIEAFRAFLKGEGFRVESDEARRDVADLSMTATFQVAQILQGQAKFDQAIEAYQGYLARFPNGPQSADAQRAILDAQIQIATEALGREKYAEARAAWEKFVAQNPLDGRVPEVLFEVGQSFEKEKKFDQAIAAWDPLIGRFPDSEPASHARFEVASIFEVEKGDPAGAIERFRKVTVNPWKAEADQRVAVMESKALTVVSPRTFRSGEPAQLKITTRNLENLTFTAYKLNAEAYFRKKHILGEVESLDIGLVAADAEWTMPVPHYAKFKPVESTYDLKVAVPGVYVVKVTDEKTLQATALVVGSDLEAIVKVSREQVLVFAQDMKTGKGRKGARVLIADGSGVILEKTTGDDGVVLASWDKPLNGSYRTPRLPNDPSPNTPPPAPDSALQYLVLDGGDAAGSILGVPDKVAQGLTARAYIYTDRPAYRPGQEVALRGVIREAKDGQYANPAGESYKLEVYDSRGRLLVARPAKLSEFGTFHESLRIDSSAPVGSYRVRVFKPGQEEFSGNFEVQSYKLEKIDLEFDLPKMVYYRGETIKGSVVAKYQFGSPVAVRPIEMALPDGRVVRGTTDASGKFAFEFPTDGFAEVQALRLVARLPGDNVAAVAGVILAINGFAIGLNTSRTVYLDGETFPLSVLTLDAQGKPSGRELRVSILKQVNQDGSITEREVSNQALTTDKETGKGSVSIKVEDEQGGGYVLRVAGTDQFGNPIVADRALEISGKADATRLRIFTDRQTFKVGETASVNLHSRSRAGTALLAWEADRILKYQIVPINEGDNPLTWPVDGPQFPNFTLTASRMAGDKFDVAALDVRVERDLRVSIKPLKPTAKPGEEVEVEVTTVDQLDRPVAAEVALALVDRSLLRQFADNQAPIGPFFYSQTRTGTFTTEATNTFQDNPTTMPVSDAVVEDAERVAAQLRNDASRKDVLEESSKMAKMLDSTRTFSDRRDQAAAKGMLGQASRPATPAPAGDFENQAVGRLAAGNPKSYADIDNKANGGRFGEIDDPAQTYYGLYLLDQQGQAGMGGGMGGQGGFAGGGGGIGGAGNFGGNGGLGYVVNPFVDHSIGRRTPVVVGSSAGGINNFNNNLSIPFTQGSAANIQPFNAIPPADRMHWSTARGGRDGVQAPALPRELFSETAYWNPAVVTGKDGKATVKFKAPMALSEYRFTARGVTGSDTLVGQASAALSVRKDFFVDLKVPATLSQGDKPRFSAAVHHVGIKGNADVKLSIYSGEREQVYPRTLDLKADGVEEILFEPFDVPDGESVRLTLTAKAGDASDELVIEVPIRPWGVQAFASASGTSSDDATVFVGLPPGRAYESPEMRIDVAPTLRRLLIELALGRDYFPLPRSLAMPCPIVLDTIADRASDLLAATSALKYLQEVRTPDAPEATRLSERIQGLVAELVSSQNDDGGWPWVAPRQGQRHQNSDHLISAQVTFALASARSVGLLADPSVADRSTNYLTREFIRAGNDYEARAALLHALAAFDKASFEQANSLNRIRQNLPDVALAYLALTLAKLDRLSLAGEVLDVLGPRAKTESAGVGKKPRKYWEGKEQGPFHRGAVETTALAALAFAKARPQSPDLDAACEWLLAHRLGNGWNPEKAKGAAVAALTSFYGKAGLAEDRYRLVVTVNDAEVYRAEVIGSPEGKAVLVPRKAIKLGDANRVRFQIEGRGTFGYAVSLTGFARDFTPEQKQDGKRFTIQNRSYLPADPELDGKALPTGFSVAINPTTFTNKITQVAQGGRAKVRIFPSLRTFSGQPAWEREFLVVEETLPAGSTLIEGSVQTSAGSFTLADNVLTFYFSPENGVGMIQYEVSGYLPGRYRALPTRIYAAYDPGQVHLGQPGDLQVLTPGERSTDPYKATPDELFARGKALFQGGKLAEAAQPLEELFGGYSLNDVTARDAARMLLTIHIKDYQPRKVVQDFEILREKGPELVIPFDEVQVVGRAYRDIGEFERAYLVFRAIVEASYLEDAQVGETLRQRGRTLEATAYLIDLWRESPNTASIESDFFGLSQILAGAATRASSDPILRRELAEAGVTRSQLLLQTIRMIQVVLAQSPKNPLVDEAGLALLGAYLELEDFESVVKLAPRFAKLYPKSTFLDSFQYSEALGQFSLGHFDRAIEVAQAIAKATYKDANGLDQPSPNKWQALYILGQIYDARRQPAKAVDFYKQVADRFADAAGAVKALTRKDLKLPEVSLVRPSGVAPADIAKPGVSLDYRNIADVDVKVYPVDLMRLYLTRRNLDGISGIDLAGITPTVEQAIKLGDGADFDEKARALELPLTKEGAYLVMARGENLYASGIVLVTPLELEVLEEAESGRVRVVVRDSKTKDPVSKVQVKVIGTHNPTFFTGQTDLRGVYVAEGVNGQVTAVARKGTAQYAFYRGKTNVGSGQLATYQGQQQKQHASRGQQPGQSPAADKQDESLDNNLKMQNSSNQIRQIERLQNRYQEKSQGVNPF
jgi:alpha-2-macroglobulin